jgi:hypothetical protein
MISSTMPSAKILLFMIATQLGEGQNCDVTASGSMIRPKARGQYSRASRRIFA